MKRFTLPLTLILPALAAATAATAAAQMTSIRFAAPVNPIASLPQILPSPMMGPLVGTGIASPSPLSVLTPSFSLAAPAAPDKPEAAIPDSSKEKLNGEFDGERVPSKPVVELPRRAAVSAGRRISLPEWDLERELGIKIAVKGRPYQEYLTV